MDSAVIRGHVARSRPLRAPALPANRLPLPSFRRGLALDAPRLVRPEGRTAPHPAIPLWPLRRHLQLADLRHRLLAQAPGRLPPDRPADPRLLGLSPDRALAQMRPHHRHAPRCPARPARAPLPLAPPPEGTGP